MSAQRKVLIVAYYWPPAGGPGVQRWLKFATYLREFGYEPILYVPDNPTYPIIDSGLLDEVPHDIRVVKKAISEPYKFAAWFSLKRTRKISSGLIPKKQSPKDKILLWIRGNLFIPDARVLWVKPSVEFLEQFIQEEQIKLVITTGPPHSLHLIGAKLKERKPNVTWMADFRDPWTTIGYHKDLLLTSWAANKHKKLEKYVLDTADHLLVTSSGTKTEFQALTKTPISVITNGFDSYEIQQIRLDEKFSLAHIGSFLADRNPEILWQALAELIRENAAFDKAFELKIIGAVSPIVVESIKKNKLADYVTLLGYLPHLEAVKQQRASQVLLLIEIDRPESKVIIPGKLFEYLAAQRPILAIGPEGADFRSLLEDAAAGRFFNYSNKQALKEYIQSLFSDFQASKLFVETKDIEQFSRKSLTKKLAALLDTLWES
ncbi:glycosyltransferase family 4 protein [Flavobacterium sp.]|uniref:glycosyltransferase family 4 protein n=1 Tax=Flavobacterium sp. TaxID=239 RepID=UPI00261418C8|nr:glycosyltransferase family 4 protein [Flavobacterium sp.]